MKNKLTVTWIVLSVIALIVSACGGPAATVAPTQPPAPVKTVGDPYRVGAFYSTTGPVSSLGQPEANSTTMVVDQINAAGGVKGPDGLMHLIELKLYDDQSDATKAVEIAKKMIEEDKVVVIIGGSGSPASIAIIETVSKAGVPFISVASSSAIVNAKDGTQNTWVFKTPQQNLPVAQVQLDWMKAHNITKVASLGVNNAFGKDSMAALTRVAKDGGIQIVYEGTFEPGDTNFSTQLTQIAGTDAQAVIVHATSGEGAPLTVQYRDMGLKMPIVHNHGIGSSAFIKTAADAANGVLLPIGKEVVASQLPDSDPQKATLLKYIADYGAKYGGANPGTFGGHAWDATMMVKAALENVGPDSAKIRDYLETKVSNFVGISGIFNVTAKDHTGIGKESLVLVEIVKGNWTFIAPADYAKVP
jgi:branched-chain amino acid transport system substrate-binding protein